jgi:glycerol-3-phosphate dehydrogenase
LQLYGADASFIGKLIQNDAGLAVQLHPDLPIRAAQVIWAAREEMARTVEDVLARRTRALFLNARAAVMMAPRVAQLMAHELRRDAAWEREQVREFGELAKGYMVTPQD